MTNEIPECFDDKFLKCVSEIERILLESGQVKEISDPGINRIYWNYRAHIDQNDIILSKRELTKLIIDHVLGNSKGISYSFTAESRSPGPEDYDGTYYNHTCELWAIETHRQVYVKLEGRGKELRLVGNTQDSEYRKTVY